MAASNAGEVSRIERAVTEGRFYDLVGVLSDDDIESLCNVEPTPPAVLLDDVFADTGRTA
jgi:hypothetical protein